jgi:hypothetical protein
MIQVIKLTSGESVICDIFNLKEMEGFLDTAECKKIIENDSILIFNPQQIVYTMTKEGDLETHMISWLPYTDAQYIIIKESAIVTSVTPSLPLEMNYIKLFTEKVLTGKGHEMIINEKSFMESQITIEQSTKMLEELIPKSDEDIN